jgi:hypothetical protein
LRGLARRRLRPAGLTILVTRGGTHRLVGSRKPRDTALPKCLASPARSREMPPPCCTTSSRRKAIAAGRTGPIPV